MKPAWVKAHPMNMIRNDDRAGPSAPHHLARVEESVSESEDESPTDHETEFRAGGKNRVTPCSLIESARSNDAQSDSEESNSGSFPSPDGSTFHTAETERPSFNPLFDEIPPGCVSRRRPGVL